jgi:hypothetical protein
VVDGQFAVEDLLQILSDIAEAEVEALQGLQLGGYSCGEGADCNVSDVS